MKLFMTNTFTISTVVHILRDFTKSPFHVLKNTCDCIIIH